MTQYRSPSGLAHALQETAPLHYNEYCPGMIADWLLPNPFEYHGDGRAKFGA
ncbi:hypothetical protein [Deinococcus yunweiensis]|uniref:hypothetical protein n=1 Tax=Deinococcus yunweiensis TaxID=367282 RepID=UPI00398E657D